jgi:hypothetical protein
MKITYRIMKIKNTMYSDGFYSGYDSYGLFEVYEHPNGSFSRPMEPELEADSIDVLRQEVELMLQAFDLPIFED